MKLQWNELSMTMSFKNIDDLTKFRNMLEYVLGVYKPKDDDEQIEVVGVANSLLSELKEQTKIPTRYGD